MKAVPIILVGLGLAIAVNAHADTRYLQTWTCKLNEGKTQADVQATNAKWVKFVNSKVKGGDVHGYVVTPVTGKVEDFTFVDSYPSLEAWAAQRAAMQTPEGEAIEAEFDQSSTCKKSELSSSTES